MDNEEKYCEECGRFLSEIESDELKYCEECKEGIDIVKRLREKWVISEEELHLYKRDSIDEKTVEEFEKELLDLEKKLKGYDHGTFDHYIESEYPPDKYEKIQIRLEKIKKILKVD